MYVPQLKAKALGSFSACSLVAYVMGYLMSAALRRRDVVIEWKKLTKKVDVAAART